MTAAQPPAEHRQSAPAVSLRARILASLAMLCLLFAPDAGLRAETRAAMREGVRATGVSEAGLTQAQGRQQALERALAEAVWSEARRMIPGEPPPARLEALRRELGPKSIDFVQSYQELVPPRPAEGAEEPQAAPPAGQPVSLELEIQPRRPALREHLLRLGLLAGERHPGVFALRLGPGVKEKDLPALDAANLLLGLARAPQAPAEITLERLPQGYFKAVLRHGAIVIAADASTLPALWLDAWGRYFADPRTQPGPGAQELALEGFAGVDAVQDFLRQLSAWDEAVQEPRLLGLDMGGAGVGARFACRVVDAGAFKAHLDEALPRLKLRRAADAAEVRP